MIFQETTTPAPLATSSIVWQIVIIALGMVVISQIFRWKFALKPERQLEMQESLQRIQDEMKLAQSQGDMDTMRELQMEMMEYSKDMMKTQFVPMCLRLVVFMILLGILSSVYGKYDYTEVAGGLSWFWIYTIISIIGNVILTVIIKKIRKMKGIEDSQPVVDNIRALQRNFNVSQPSSSSSFPMRDPGYISNEQQSLSDQSVTASTEKAWKKKLKD